VEPPKAVNTLFPNRRQKALQFVHAFHKQGIKISARFLVYMSLDLYTKYLWTRQEGDSVTMAEERYKFDDIDSQRWRTGARFSYNAATDGGRVFTPYIDAAFDYEFDSEAKGSVNGRGIDSPDIEGATGMGELSLAFKPSADSGFSLDLGVQGYTGKREGVSGSFQVKFKF